MCFASLVSTANAQTSANVGVGASVVEYDGFLFSGAGSLSSAVQFDAPQYSVGGQAGWTIFESGNQIVQASAAAAWLTQSRAPWRAELSASAGVSSYADLPLSGHALMRGRLHLHAHQRGGWLSATTGASFDGSTAAPVELGVGAWTIRDRIALVGTVLATWLGDERHTDIAGAVRWTSDRFEVETRVGARPWTKRSDELGDAPDRVWGEVAALIPLVKSVSLALSGGSYPSDPVRRVLGARYATAGLRFTLAGADRAPPLIAPATIAAITDRNNADRTAEARLEIAPGDPLHALRVHAAGATTVELAADFNDWQAQPLQNVGDGTWELQLRLVPGVYRVNLRIDGGPWIVPSGARPEQDEFGGVVGVVVVR